MENTENTENTGTPNRQAMSAVSNFAGDFYAMSKGYRNNSEYIKDGIIQFGKNNDFPSKIERLITDSPWHGKLINSTVKFIVGEGLYLRREGAQDEAGLRALQIANELGETWQEVDQQVSRSLKIHNGVAFIIIWSFDRNSIAEVRVERFTDVRACEPDAFGRITEYKINDWKRGLTKAQADGAEAIPVFNPAMRQEQPKQILYCNFGGNFGQTYPSPDILSITDNILIDKLLNKHKVAFLRNGINVANVMQLVTDMDPKQFQKFVNGFDRNLKGAENSGGTAYLKVPTGGTFHQIQNPSTKGNAETFNSYYEQNTNIIFAGHDVIYRDMMGVESTQSSLSADRVIEKSVLYNNTVSGDFHRKKTDTYAKLTPFIFPGMELFVKPRRLFDGLGEVLAQAGIIDRAGAMDGNQINPE